MDRRSSIGIITKASFLVGILPENILLNALKSDKKGEPTDFAILFESLARNILGDHYIEFRKENIYIFNSDSFRIINQHLNQ